MAQRDGASLPLRLFYNCPGRPPFFSLSRLPALRPRLTPMPVADKLEGQLAELQRKYRIMQGDKQAYAETSSLTLRKQRYVARRCRRCPLAAVSACPLPPPAPLVLPRLPSRTLRRSLLAARLLGPGLTSSS